MLRVKVKELYVYVAEAGEVELLQEGVVVYWQKAKAELREYIANREVSSELLCELAAQHSTESFEVVTGGHCYVVKEGKVLDYAESASTGSNLTLYYDEERLEDLPYPEILLGAVLEREARYPAERSILSEVIEEKRGSTEYVDYLFDVVAEAQKGVDLVCIIWDEKAEKFERYMRQEKEKEIESAKKYVQRLKKGQAENEVIRKLVEDIRETEKKEKKSLTV